MRTDIRTKQVTETYKVYIAKDGKEFHDEEDCIHHEKILDGTRIVCPRCNGDGYINGRYIEPYDHWEGKMGGYYDCDKCPKCNGKGYLEKKVIWE